MIFDINTLKPKFQLEIGEAGESNAFIIALKLGMDQSLIELAHEASYDEKMDYDQVIAAFSTNKPTIPPAFSKAKRPKAMDQHKVETPPEINETSFEIGDIVYVHTIKQRGIICELENKKGEYGIKVGDKTVVVHKKRLELFIDNKQLYPEDYDFDIVLKSWDYRKKNKIMNKRYDPTIEIVDGK
jgi:DNA mismatch repair protein MutS2